MVGWNFFLFLLNCSAWPCLGPAWQDLQRINLISVFLCQDSRFEWVFRPQSCFGHMRWNPSRLANPLFWPPTPARKRRVLCAGLMRATLLWRMQQWLINFAKSNAHVKSPSSVNFAFSHNWHEMIRTAVEDSMWNLSPAHAQNTASPLSTHDCLSQSSSAFHFPRRGELQDRKILKWLVGICMLLQWWINYMWYSGGVKRRCVVKMASSTSSCKILMPFLVSFTLGWFSVLSVLAYLIILMLEWWWDTINKDTEP